MLTNRSIERSRLLGVLAIPYFLLISFLIKESSARILCHSYEELEAGENYALTHNGYIEEDFEDTRCTWDLKAPEGHIIKLNCEMNIEMESCPIQALDVYRNFNSTMDFPDMYCVNGKFTTTSEARSLRIVMRRVFSRASQLYRCNVQAVRSL